VGTVTKDPALPWEIVKNDGNSMHDQANVCSTKKTQTGDKRQFHFCHEHPEEESSALDVRYEKPLRKKRRRGRA